MKTRTIKQNESKNNQKTYVINASGVRMGKLITTVAKILLGKYNIGSVRYLPFSDKVVINNAQMLSYFPTRGDKQYFRHSGILGGLRSETLSSLLKNKTEYILKRSIWGMLPKNRYGRKLLSNVTINLTDIEIPNSIKVEIN